MLKKRMRFLAGWLLVTLLLAVTPGDAWECGDDLVSFTHAPSDYYGPGEYFAICPGTNIQIRCYHYHRHWVCEKEETYFWDRNLTSAASTACGCSLPDGVAPAAPALSRQPATGNPVLRRARA